MSTPLHLSQPNRTEREEGEENCGLNDRHDTELEYNCNIRACFINSLQIIQDDITKWQWLVST